MRHNILGVSCLGHLWWIKMLKDLILGAFFQQIHIFLNVGQQFTCFVGCIDVIHGLYKSRYFDASSLLYCLLYCCVTRIYDSLLESLSTCRLAFIDLCA